MISMQEQRLAHLWLDANAKQGEEWGVLVDGNKVYIRASADEEVRRHVLSMAEFKAILIAVYSGTIDLVCVTIPSDAQRHYDGPDLLIWLTSTLAGSRKFLIASYPIEKSTSELIAAFRAADGGVE